MRLEVAVFFCCLFGLNVDVQNYGLVEYIEGAGTPKD